MSALEVNVGRGRGGYTERQVFYKDTAGRKVIDRGAIFVAERYMDLGFEPVFRCERRKNGARQYDLTIKTSDDLYYIKNIEVKRTTSPNPSQMAKNIKEGFGQFKYYSNATVAIYLPQYDSNSVEGRKYIQAGFNEAMRKGHVLGHVEVWFNDKGTIYMNSGGIL